MIYKLLWMATLIRKCIRLLHKTRLATTSKSKYMMSSIMSTFTISQSITKKYWLINSMTKFYSIFCLKLLLHHHQMQAVVVVMVLHLIVVVLHLIVVVLHLIVVVLHLIVVVLVLVVFGGGLCWELQAQLKQLAVVRTVEIYYLKISRSTNVDFKITNS